MHQCRLIVNHRVKWILNRNASIIIFFQENAFQNVVCKMAAVLFRLWCVESVVFPWFLHKQHFQYCGHSSCEQNTRDFGPVIRHLVSKSSHQTTPFKVKPSDSLLVSHDDVYQRIYIWMWKRSEYLPLRFYRGHYMCIYAVSFFTIMQVTLALTPVSSLVQ